MALFAPGSKKQTMLRWDHVPPETNGEGKPLTLPETMPSELLVALQILTEATRSSSPPSPLANHMPSAYATMVDMLGVALEKYQKKSQRIRWFNAARATSSGPQSEGPKRE